MTRFEGGVITKVPGTYWPKDGMPAWRYMSFDKFVEFLIHRHIQFTRASLFTDQSELRLFQDHIDAESAAAHAAAELHLRIQDLKNRTFVSCWSLGRSESYPLWKIYLGGARNGVALRTTVGRLRSVFEASPRAYFEGGVQYRHSVFDKSPTEEQLICTKGEPYQYEREFRIFTRYVAEAADRLEPSLTPNTVAEDVDVARLLTSIWISPFSSTWFESTVRDTVKVLAPDLRTAIRKSAIQDQ